MKRLTSSFLLLCAICLLIGAKTSGSQKEQFSRKLHTLNSIVKELNANYADTLPAAQIMDKTISALLYQIDPYTEYYPADDKDELLSISEGKYAGIGAVISKRGDKVIIRQPQWESPARAAGLRPGDIILAVNGDSVTPKMDVSDVSSRLRGQAGTEVKIAVRRPHVQDSLLNFTITRSDIVVNPLPYSGIDSSGIGYIRLTTFNESSARRVREAILNMMADKNFRGLILDLRENGGGLLESAVQIASNFVPKGTEILRTRGRDIRDERIYKTTSKPLDTAIPLAILIDEGTASASEIVAGSMQDLDRAVIIGERSFGKGLVQSPRPLPYNELLKITTGRYYIPSGRLIQALDYSHRDDDGSPIRTPDSLTNIFHTRAGRQVRDGGGITPDIKIDRPTMNRLIYNIMYDMWAFDFATKFATTHPTLPPNFTVTDSLFNAFKASIDPARFKYDKQCDTGLKYLRETAESYGYMNDSVRAQFDILAAMLKHDLNQDLDLNRKDIERVLLDEIEPQYMSDGQRIQQSYADDPAVQRARKVLLDPKEYRKLLRP